MDFIVVKLAIASWFIAICLDVSSLRHAWTYDAENKLIWPIKTASYLAAFVFTLALIATM